MNKPWNKVTTFRCNISSFKKVSVKLRQVIDTVSVSVPILFPPLYIQQVPGADAGQTKKSKSWLSIKQKPRTLPVARTMTQWHLATNQWSLPAAEKRSPALLELGMTMSFQTQGARAAKLKSMKLQASKWETIFPATSDILNLPPSFIWLHRLVCCCSELNWQTDIVKTHCQWITLGRSDWSICESPRGDQKLTALAFLATYLLTRI